MSKKKHHTCPLFCVARAPSKNWAAPGRVLFFNLTPTRWDKMLVSRGAKQRFKETEPDESVHLTILVRVLLPQPPSAEKNERQGGGGRLWLELRGKLVHLRWVDWQVGKRRLRWQKFTRFMSLIVNLETVPKKVALVTNLPIELKTHNQ